MKKLTLKEAFELPNVDVKNVFSQASNSLNKGLDVAKAGAKSALDKSADMMQTANDNFAKFIKQGVYHSDKISILGKSLSHSDLLMIAGGLATAVLIPISYFVTKALTTDKTYENTLKTFTKESQVLELYIQQLIMDGRVKGYKLVKEGQYGIIYGGDTPLLLNIKTNKKLVEVALGTNAGVVKADVPYQTLEKMKTEKYTKELLSAMESIRKLSKKLKWKN